MPINPKQFETLIEQIQSNQYTKEFLDLRNQQINDADVKRLVLALKNNSYIKKVNLSINNIGPTGAGYLAKANLISLNLSANPLKDEGAKTFSETSHITELSLEECSIGDTGAAFVLSNKKLRVVSLATNNLTDDALEKLPSESALIELNLRQNKITSKSARNIASCKALDKADLGSNDFGDEGALTFAQTKLKYLDLMQNGLTNKGFSALCQSKTLQYLKLFNNDISFQETDSLAISAPLIHLNLASNQIDEKCQNILKSLASIPTLENLDVSSNAIKDSGANLLFQHHSKSLKKIDLEDNPIVNIKLIQEGFSLKK